MVQRMPAYKEPHNYSVICKDFLGASALQISVVKDARVKNVRFLFEAEK